MTEATVAEVQEDAETVPEIDVEAALAAVQAENAAVFGLLTMVRDNRQKMEEFRDQYRKSADTKSTFETALENSQDPEVVKIRNAMADLKHKLNELRSLAVNALHVGGAVTGISEDERSVLKGKVSEHRKMKRSARKLVEEYFNQVPGSQKFAYLLDHIDPAGSDDDSPSTTKNGTTNTDAGKIREWAKENNIPVNERGRIPADLVAKFNAANPPVDDDAENVEE